MSEQLSRLHKVNKILHARLDMPTEVRLPNGTNMEVDAPQTSDATIISRKRSANEISDSLLDVCEAFNVTQSSGRSSCC